MFVEDTINPNPPAISVIIPTHRRPEMLRKLLDSLTAQSFGLDRFEIIVVATENDPAFSIVSQIQQKNTVAIQCVWVPDDPTNGRSASAKRNYGVSLARAPWIAFIDDDCIAHPNWLAGAAPLFENPKHGAVEGRKEIPPTDRPTVTWHGLQLLTHPKGYQTCNMFYRKDVFQQVGGFDPNLPYYLEDSDLAWTVLEAGYEIPFASDAVVYHAIVTSPPWKQLDDARRAVLMPYLYKKHRATYRAAGTKVLRASHWMYIALYAILIACAIARFWPGILAATAAVLILIALHAIKRFRNCFIEPGELRATLLLLPVLPVIKLAQLYRGNLKFKTWLWT